VVLHTGPADTGFVLPRAPWASTYEVLLDTADEEPVGRAPLAPGDRLPLVGRSLVLLEARR